MWRYDRRDYYKIRAKSGRNRVEILRKIVTDMSRGDRPATVLRAYSAADAVCV